MKNSNIGFKRKLPQIKMSIGWFQSIQGAWNRQRSVLLDFLPEVGFFKKYLFIYLPVSGLTYPVWELSLQHVESSSPTRDRTCAPCFGSTES